MPYGITCRRNGGQTCDMLVGPCSCGASHSIDDYSKEEIGELLIREQKILNSLIWGLASIMERRLKKYKAAKKRSKSIEKKRNLGIKARATKECLQDVKKVIKDFDVKDLRGLIFN